MALHELKIWPEHFRAIREGRKAFEVRKITDRCFDEGDTLLLKEWLPDEQRFTGENTLVKVTLVYAGAGVWGDYVVMGIAPVVPHKVGSDFVIHAFDDDGKTVSVIPAQIEIGMLAVGKHGMAIHLGQSTIPKGNHKLVAILDRPSEVGQA